MPVTVERADGVATITFADPPVNLYSRALHEDFDAAFEQIDADPPRVLVIRAEGKVVSGGVDVSEFFAQKTHDDTKILYDRMIELPERVAALSIPTVFVAHGLTLTWALEVALASDIILASTKAKFGLVERVIGLTPTMGGTQRIAARAGLARAREVVFTGDLFDAATFERWNIVNRVFEPDELDAGVAAFVAHLASGPTQAFAASKQILREFEAGGVPRAIDVTTELTAALFHTEDLQHGMDSFLTDGPGKATFSGR